ncbi:MAG: GGDEF domain-containing protein [Clostridia bacterium]|nr:GGDEF domain-containing protein [Clostridia bacterium]
MTYYTPLTILVWLTLVILCILVRENDRLTKRQKTVLYSTYFIVGLAALAEWLGIRWNGNTAISPWLLRIVKFFDYVLTPLSGGAILLQFRKRSRWQRILYFILAGNALFQFVSLFTGWMLTVDENNRYTHGPGYTVYVVAYLIITLLVILEFALYGRTFRKQNRFSLYGIMVFAVTGIALQEVMGGQVRTAYISLAISMALLFIHNSEFAQLESDDRIHEQMIRISEDPLTGLASRYAYTAAMEKWSGKRALPPDFTVFSIDVNGLKAVNDTLGHNAGDELICGAADCMRSVFAGHGTCYRTGGDEFIVFATVPEEEVEVLTERLEEKAAAWHGKEARSLSLAVGSVRADMNPGVDLEKLVCLADRGMYISKDIYYKETGLDRRKI